MIARIWHGAVPRERADDYLRLMREVGLADYRSVAGNRGAYVLRRDEETIAHFHMLTFWDSWRAVADFAGEDVSAAKYYDFDSDFLVEQEPTVHHYDVYDA